MSPKYAPAREDGTKPYVVTIRDMGRVYTTVTYGRTVGEARREALGRPYPGRYVMRAHRATPEDMEPTR